MTRIIALAPRIIIIIITIIKRRTKLWKYQHLNNNKSQYHFITHSNQYVIMTHNFLIYQSITNWLFLLIWYLKWNDDDDDVDVWINLEKRGGIVCLFPHYHHHQNIIIHYYQSMMMTSWWRPLYFLNELWYNMLQCVCVFV